MHSFIKTKFSFLILLIFSGLILSVPGQSLAQNQPKQSAQPAVTVSVVNAPDQAPVAAPKQSPQPAAAVPAVPVAAPSQAPVEKKNSMPSSVVCTTVAATTEYEVGTDDILDISVLQPEQIADTVTVSPDGSITFPYIGSVQVRGKTLAQIQDTIQNRLSDGYMRYPVVSVDLKESHSRRFFVYGEVSKPGAFDMEDNLTVLRGISMAGGFTQFGSASRVKILRPKRGEGGYDVIKVNIKDVMDGVPDTDPAIEQGDIIVVSEGIF